jgi:hypothetical protein
LNLAITALSTFSELAQRKRVGLITQRSYDRNVDSLFFDSLAVVKIIFSFFVEAKKIKKKVLPGIEPGFGDSESPVITVTLQDLLVSSGTTRPQYPGQVTLRPLFLLVVTSLIV